tara:strand:+ start:1970 stop:2524 length:555 start_codon:yes stop_codon:yes gene_type:complete
MLIKNNSIHTVEDAGDVIIKSFVKPKTHLTEEWYDQYSEFEAETGIVPQLFECSPDRIVMEKLPGQILADTIDDIDYCREPYKFFKILRIINTVHNAFNTWNEKEQDIYVTHGDLSCYNIMVDDQDYWLIEPEHVYFKEFIDLKTEQFNHHIRDINYMVNELQLSMIKRINVYWRDYYESSNSK